MALPSAGTKVSMSLTPISVLPHPQGRIIKHPVDEARHSITACTEAIWYGLHEKEANFSWIGNR
jgi:hypothetical protein